MLLLLKTKIRKQGFRVHRGGVFSLLAEEVWMAGGIVYGAGFIDNFRVVHIRADKKSDFFFGSKYVQSYIGTIYREVKKDLNSGRRVLFSGAPCQVIGLKKCLNREYENLITVDFICHGVPSPDIWDRYAACLMKKYGSNIKISFRDKNLSWNEFSFTVRDGEDKILYSKTLNEDPYLKAFLKNITLCEACSNCNFRGSNRKSDITLADFWRVEEYFTKFNDNAGTSVIILNSIQGKKLLEIIKPQLVYQEFHDYHILLTGNPTYMEPQMLWLKRNKFFKEIQNSDKDVIYLLTRYTKGSLWERGKRKVKQGIRKIIKSFILLNGKEI